MPDSQSNSPVEKELTPLVEIKTRFTGEVICSGETIAKAAASSANLNFANLSSANLRFANLSFSDLSFANLSSANLRFANLSFSDLSFANLSSANLNFANLSSANLRSANLSFADLSSANLRYADLSSADLRSARISWRSHDLISEILKRSSGDDIAKLKVAGLILVCREKCWSEFLSICDPLSEWAIDVLRGWIVDGDDHPKCLDTTEVSAGNS